MWTCIGGEDQIADAKTADAAQAMWGRDAAGRGKTGKIPFRRLAVSRRCVLIFGDKARAQIGLIRRLGAWQKVDGEDVGCGCVWKGGKPLAGRYLYKFYIGACFGADIDIIIGHIEIEGRIRALSSVQAHHIAQPVCGIVDAQSAGVAHIEAVVARAAAQGVIASISCNNVVTVTAKQRIAAAAANDDVIVCTAINAVVAIFSIKIVDLCAAVDGVVAFAAKDVVVALTAADAVVAKLAEYQIFIVAAVDCIIKTEFAVVDRLVWRALDELAVVSVLAANDPVVFRTCFGYGSRPGRWWRMRPLCPIR